MAGMIPNDNSAQSPGIVNPETGVFCCSASQGLLAAPDQQPQDFGPVFAAPQSSTQESSVYRPHSHALDPNPPSLAHHIISTASYEALHAAILKTALKATLADRDFTCRFGGGDNASATSFPHLPSQEQLSEQLNGSYQSIILQHWYELRGQQALPLKRQFRPQIFASYIPKMAVIGLERDLDPHYNIRLSGAAVYEHLQLSPGMSWPFCTAALEGLSPNISPLPALKHLNEEHKLLCNLFNEALMRREPVYACALLPAENQEFSALILPFASTEDTSKINHLIAAFDFPTAPIKNR